MDIEKLANRLLEYALNENATEYDRQVMADAAHELSRLLMEKNLAENRAERHKRDAVALKSENAEMKKQLNEFSEFLCCMTGNLLSKTNYTAQAMIEAAEDYQQRVCDDCDRVEVIGNDELIDELQSVQADLARVTAELADCREKNAGLALALLFECAPNPDVAEKPAIEDILKVVFQPGYDVVTIYNPPDEDGLYTMTVTGVISKEEYEAALKARKQDEP